MNYQHDVGKELRSINYLIRRYIDNSAAKKAIDSASGSNGWIIAYIADHADRDTYQKHLEQEFSITRSTASKLVSSMVEKGLVEKHMVPQDARLKKLTLTPKAQKLADGIAADRREVHNKLTRGFSEEELDQLMGYLGRLKENMKD